MKPRDEPGSSRCQHCGAPLIANAPGGFCLRCALANAVDHGPVHSEGMPSAVPVPDVAFRCFGDYELLEEIGRGGMGAVYKARQISLHRYVAVKMLLSGQLADKQFVRRFRTEASAAALLQHPNIVAIHEVGVHQSQNYFSMDYVDGPNLAELAKARPLSARQAARYVQIIAQAIHYAHLQGILHRDLKPSNIIIDSADEPHVTDFGLARRLEHDSDLTLSGHVLGSPSYMPPEQAGGRQRKVDRTSDIYSLGAILYHLLTGRPPFLGESLPDTLQQVLSNEPVSPRLLNSAVPLDLETICLKCLQKEPERRYPTAEAVAGELGRFLRDEPILARPAGALEKGSRWCRRNPKMAGMAASLVAVFVAGFLSVLWQWRRAELTTLDLRRNSYAADMNLAMQAWEGGNIGRARQLLEKHQTLEPKIHGFEWRLLQQLCRQSDARHTLGTRDPIGSVALIRDDIISAGEDGIIRLWDFGQGNLRTNWQGHTARIHVLAVSPNGRLFASGGRDNKVILWDGVTNRPFTGHSGAIRALAFSSDGRFLVSGSEDKTIRFWDVATGNQLKQFEESIGVEDVAFSPVDPDLLAVSGPDTRVHLWQISQRQKREVGSHHSYLMAIGFSPDGRVLASAGFDGIVELWNLKQGESLGTLGRGAPIRCLSFSPDGQLLATAGNDAVVHLWSMRTRQHVRAFRGHSDSIGSLVFSNDGRWLISGSDDGAVNVWEAISTGERQDALIHGGIVNALAFSPDGALLATAASRDTARLWDVATRQELANFRAEPRSIWSLAFAPNAKTLVLAGAEGSLRLWDVAARRQRALRKAHSPEAIESVAVSPDSRWIATASRDCTLKLWDAATLDEIAVLPGSHDIMRAVAFSPDGQWLAAGGRDRKLIVCPFSNLERPALTNSFTLAGHQAEIWCVTFSPTEPVLAASDGNRMILLWNLQLQRLHAQFQSHDAAIKALAFSPDGRTLASGSDDGTIKLWNLNLGQEVGTLRGHSSQVRQIAFSPDGNILATASSDGTVRLWNAPVSKSAF